MPPLSSPSTKTTQTLNTTRTLRKHKQEEKNKSNREHNFIATFASLDYVDHSLCEYLLIIALANILTILYYLARIKTCIELKCSRPIN